MRIDNPTKEQLKIWINNLNKYVISNFTLVETKYVDLGVKTIRILNYSKDFSHLIEKQLAYSLKDNADKYDATLIIWKEPAVKNIYFRLMPEYSPKKDFKKRLFMLSSEYKGESVWIFDGNYSNISPVICADTYRNITNAADIENNTYYLGVENLDPEEFIKEGHIFVQDFNKILKTPDTNLVHGACVGLNNKGILFCARGQRGKSTLAVLSMMKGFEYVSDDYLTLEKTSDGLFAYPIYSIITLSPKIYNELFDELENSRFLFNNARKDKYVINIANFHKQFRSKYPIKVCMFPEIVPDKEPSVRKCSKEEKGRALVQLIQSSVSQMQDLTDQDIIRKLFKMVEPFEFYKINLCGNIYKNTESLKDFIENYKPQPDNTSLDRFLVDITFDLANIIDTETFTIYSMNKFATCIYNNLIHGVTTEKIIKELSKTDSVPLSMYHKINSFAKLMKEKGFVKELKDLGIKPRINPEFIRECNGKLSVIELGRKEMIELLKES